MDNSYKEVRFDQYCASCTNKDTDGANEPCDSCISMPMRFGTQVPYRYKKAPASTLRRRKRNR